MGLARHKPKLGDGRRFGVLPVVRQRDRSGGLMPVQADIWSVDVNRSSLRAGHRMEEFSAGRSSQGSRFVADALRRRHMTELKARGTISRIF